MRRTFKLETYVDGQLVSTQPLSSIGKDVTFGALQDLTKDGRVRLRVVLTQEVNKC